MTGILLINMGSPSSQKEMKEFLFNMLSDKAILPFPTLPRKLLAFMISNIRHRSSWEKYELIGGSPLKSSMSAINDDLSKELGEKHHVYTAYSYSKPSIGNAAEYFSKKGIKDIKVLTMYPHTSITTTGSIETDIEKAKKGFPELNFSMYGPYALHKKYLEYCVNLIIEAAAKNHFTRPTLVFSAHAIPSYLLEKGDSYVEELKQAAAEMAKQMEAPYRLAFQSKIGRVEWVGPDTKALLKELKQEGCEQIIMVPISFINENLETLYDLDVEIIPYAKELGIKEICRVQLPPTHPLLIDTFKQIITQAE